MLRMNRRQLLGSSAVVLLALSSRSVRAAIVKGGLPWKPGAADPPAVVTPDGWKYFTPQEAATVEAFVDRLIPPDPDKHLAARIAAAPYSSIASSPGLTAGSTAIT